MNIINNIEKQIAKTDKWTTKENSGGQANFLAFIVVAAAVIGAIVSILE